MSKTRLLLISASLVLACLCISFITHKSVVFAAPIPGAPSNITPDTSDLGGLPTYMVNEICATTDCMPGKITVAAIYVPKNTVGPIAMTVVDGCDNTGIDRNGGSTTTFYGIRGDLIIGGKSGFVNSDYNCVLGDVKFSFTPIPTPGFVQGNYDMYLFTGDMVGPGATDGIYAYNYYRLRAETGGVYVGVSPITMDCPIDKYPLSCASISPLTGKNSGYSSFGQVSIPGQPNGGNYNQHINIEGCTIPMYGVIDLYDLDAGKYGQNDIRVSMIKTDAAGNVSYVPDQNGAPINDTSYPLGAGWFPAKNTGQDGHLILPVPGTGPSTYTFEPNNKYEIRINNLTRTNTLQILIQYSANLDGSGGSNCSPPPVTCTISNVRTLAGSTAIYKGDAIKFDVTTSKLSKSYQLGANGASYTPNHSNYYVSGSASTYARGSPVGSSGASSLPLSGGTTTIDDMMLSPNLASDPGSLTQMIAGVPNTYQFNWGLVEPNVGWLTGVTCTGTFDVKQNVTGNAFGSLGATCAGNVITVFMSVTDPDGGNIPVSVNIPNNPVFTGTFASVISPAAYTIGLWGGQLQDGLQHQITGTGKDAQTGAVFTLLAGNFKCPLVSTTALCPNVPGYFAVGNGGKKTITANQNIVSYFNTAGYSFWDQNPPPLTVDKYTADSTSAGPAVLSGVKVTDSPTNSGLPHTENAASITSDFTSIVDSYPYDNHNVTAEYRFRVRNDHYTRNGGYVTTYTYAWVTTDPVTKKVTSGTQSGLTSQPASSANTVWSFVGFYGNWATYSLSTYWVYDTGSTAYPLLADCEYRKFDLVPNALQPTLDDTENPTGYKSVTNINATLSLPIPKRIFAPLVVNNIGMTTTYSIEKASGAIVQIKVSPTTRYIGGSGSLPMSDPASGGLWPISRPPLDAGDRICMVVTIAPAQGLMNSSGNVVSIIVPSRTDPPPPTNCGSAASGSAATSLRVVDKPYLKSYGADVSAGQAFNPASGSCAAVSGKGVYAFAKGSGTSYRGASSEFGVLSLINVNQFYSVSQRTGNNSQPKGMTFGNAPGVGDPTYGGAFGGSGTCITDYYNATQDTKLPARTDFQSGSFPAGKSRYVMPAGNINIHNLKIPKGIQVAVYINGNVYIDDNITYDASARSSRSDIPYFALIVKGNIYVAPTVTRLDGLFVAQPTNVASPANGKFYTCSPSIGALYSATTLYASCRQQLSVNGAIIANQIKFLRSNKTLKDSVTKELPNFATGIGTNASEVINFTPEMYVAPSPLIDPLNNSINSKYDAIFSLPPVF